jgi:hypothetical protein
VRNRLLQITAHHVRILGIDMGRLPSGTLVAQRDDPWSRSSREIRRSERLAITRADLVWAHLSSSYVLSPGSALVLGGCIR